MSFLSGLFKQKQGQDAGNAFTPLQGDATAASQAYLRRGAQDASNEVMADPRFASLFGQQGQLGNAESEANDLATRGYSLQPQDYEAYDQSAGDIARQFGNAESGLSQALASRGLSRSGAAPRAFMTSQGNKLESLAKLQTDIAQKRMQSNMERLNQTRNYINQLTGQYQGALGAKDSLAQGKGQMGLNSLNLMQQQSNENMAQRQATAKGSPFASIVGGAVGGGLSGAMSGGLPGAAAGAGVGGLHGGLGQSSAAGPAGGSAGTLFTSAQKKPVGA